MAYEPWLHGTGYGRAMEDVPQYQKEYQKRLKPYNEHTLEQIRKMPIWAAAEWNGYYVLFVATDGGTEIDEDGILPEGMETLFVRKKDGAVLTVNSPSAFHYFVVPQYLMNVPASPLPEVPFDNLKIG